MAQPQFESGKSAFQAAFKKSPKLLKHLEALKNAKDPRAKPDMPAGDYVLRVQTVVFSQRNDIPRARVNFVVDEGPYKGSLVNKDYDFGSTAGNIPEEEIFARIGVDLTRMGESPKDITDPESLAEAFEALGVSKPRIAAKIDFSASGYVRVWPNRIAVAPVAGVPVQTPVRMPRTTRAPKVEAPKVEEVASEVPDDQDDQEGQDGVADPVISDQDAVEKGDKVLVKVEGHRRRVECVVVSSDATLETCAVRAPNGSVYGDIPWSEVQFVFQD